MKWVQKKPYVIVVLLLLAALSILGTAQGQGSFFGNIMSYDPVDQWVLFTDHTGTWHAPLVIHNGAAPSNSVTEFTVNTDNQFEIQTFNQGNLASYLDLDTDGSVALYGRTGGGGIGVEGTSGDTCIPAASAAPCSSIAMRVNPNGVLTQYRGQALAGNGLNTILYYADATLTGGFGPYTIFTTNASGYAGSGMYRLSGYMTDTAVAPGGSMQFVLGYTDETGPQNQSTGVPIPFDVVGSNLPFSFVLYSQGGKSINITTLTTGNPTYTIHLRLEAL